MPSWTDETGYSWFKKLECKRCLQRFDESPEGEVPVHDCLGGLWTSESHDGEWHMPVPIRRKEDDMTIDSRPPARKYHDPLALTPTEILVWSVLTKVAFDRARACEILGLAEKTLQTHIRNLRDKGKRVPYKNASL
jgi:DNA-binding CsgD family transcriptional regulator